VVNFVSNVGMRGGVLYTRGGSNTVLTCHDNSTVTFIDNRATYGGVMYITRSATILFSANSVVSFARNTASLGGVIYAPDDLQMSFNGSTAVTFLNNTATSNGGAVHITNSNILFNAPVIFRHNIAQNGQAVYCASGSSLRFVENLYKALANNNAEDGVDLSNCDVSVEKYTCKCKKIMKTLGSVLDGLENLCHTVLLGKFTGRVHFHACIAT